MANIVKIVLPNGDGARQSRLIIEMLLRPSSGGRRVRRPGSGFNPVSTPRRWSEAFKYCLRKVASKDIFRRGDGFGPGGKPGGLDRQPM